MTAAIEHSAVNRDEEEFLRLWRLLKAAGKLPGFLATFRTHLAGCEVARANPDLKIVRNAREPPR